MTTETTVLEDGIDRMTQLGYEPAEYITQFNTWLERGDDILIYSNHDLGTLAGRMLGMATPWKRDQPTPPHGPDGEWGLGWRYLVDIRITRND